jgi:hypothetical protein
MDHSAPHQTGPPLFYNWALRHTYNWLDWPRIAPSPRNPEFLAKETNGLTASRQRTRTKEVRVENSGDNLKHTPKIAENLKYKE